MTEHKQIYEPSNNHIWNIRGDMTCHLRHKTKSQYGRFYSLTTPLVMLLVIGRRYPQVKQTHRIDEWELKQRILLANAFRIQ